MIKTYDKLQRFKEKNKGLIMRNFISIKAVTLSIIFSIISAGSLLAETATIDSDCATLTITSSDAAVDGHYYIDLDGTIKNGSYYMISLFMDDNQIVTKSSFSGNSYSALEGPFSGEHLFKLDMRGGASHGICSADVELLAGAITDPIELSGKLCTDIKALPGKVFKNNPHQRKNALCNKLEEVATLIDYGFNSTDLVIQGQFYVDALEKLVKDIGDKMDGSYGGKVKNDWITDPATQSKIFPKIENITAIIEDRL